MWINIKKFDLENAFNGLDGSLLDVNTASIKTENLHDYFFGFIGVGLGLASILYGLLGYAEFSPIYRLTAGSWFFLIFGIICLVAGGIFALKATVFTVTLKTFLQNANFTKCNIKCSIQTRFYKDGGVKDAYSQSFYAVRIFDIDNKGKRQTKIIKGLLASKYFKNWRSEFELDPPYFSLNDCTVAYNEKGKAILI